jgi:transposase
LHLSLQYLVILAQPFSPQHLNPLSFAPFFIPDYVEEALGPTLMPGDIVVMDNLSVHKVAGVEAAITARGARGEYLPPYSSDYNPIEKVWSKLKTALRAAMARAVEQFFEALKAALMTISKTDARAWFTHCGYPVH